MVIDSGAGPTLIRRDALPPGALALVKEASEEGAIKLRDTSGARLLTSSSVSLSGKSCSRVAPCKYLLADDLSVPRILGCAFIDEKAQVILRSDENFRSMEGSCTCIFGGPGDRGDRWEPHRGCCACYIT